MGRRIQIAKKPPTPLRKWGEEPAITHTVSRSNMLDAKCGAAWKLNGDGMTINRSKVTCAKCMEEEPTP